MPEWKQKLAAKMKELEDASALNESGGNAAFAPTATQNANNPRMLPKASLSAAAQTDALQQRTMDMMQYSMSEDERDSVKEQIRKAQSELDKMEPVAQISDSGRKGMRNDRFIDKIIKALSATGYKVENRAVGEITFSEDELRDSLKYIVNDAEAAAYLALPRVLRRGIIINERSNHKDRGYDTITLAAPIVLNGERANMGVLIKKTKGNKYKVHRILTPDGEVFVLPEMADAEPTMPVVSPKLPSLREGRLEPSALRQKHKINASNHSVAEKSGEVKRQFSFGDNAEKIATDSNGKELSEKQQQYFKDSLVRDEDGRLLVVYHGTDAEFTVFDRTKTRANMDIQGNFFSPWEIDAQGYGSKVKAYYLNIKNPAPEGIAYKALNRFKGQNNAGIKARDYLESLGYDGVDNGGGEYIAFYPEQIKDIENLNPTISPDYRWSISENMTEKKEVVQNIKSIMDKGQGKNVVELKRYVDTLNSGASPAKDRVRMLPTAAQTEAEKIIAAAHREGLNVEEYLRRNSELYEVEGRYDAAAREALAMEKRQSGRQFSISDTLDSDLDRVLAGTFPAHRGEVYIGETSYFLKRKLKARALKVTMPVNKAYAAMVSKEKAIKDGRYDEALTYHKLGKEGLIRALMASEEPAAAFAAVPDGKKKRTNSVVLVTDSPGEDGPLIVIEAIDEKARLNNKKIEVNKTVTAYDRKQIEADIIEAAKDGRLLYLDKEKSQTFMNLAGGPGYNSLAVIREADFDNNILNFLNEVKWQKSGRDSYTEGDSEKEYPLAEAYRAALQKKEGRQYSFADDAASGDNSEQELSPSVRMLLPTDAARHLRNAEKRSLERLSEVFALPFGSDILQDIVVKISDEYLENGKTDNDTVNEMFELAYIRSTAAGQKIYQKYKGVLEYLTKQPMAIDNTTADILSENEVRRIMILSGDFLHISDDGLSVNEVYKKVKPMAPELFKGKLSAHEQLLRIYDAANALNSLRASLALRYSDDAEDNKNILKHEFRAAVDAGLPSLKDIRRFAESRKRQREGRDLERQAQREAVDDVWSYFVNPKANISRNSKNVNNGSAARNAAILCCQELSVK